MSAPAAPAAGAAPSRRIPLLAWALVAALCTAPFLRAQRAPPPGQAFIGAFHFPADVYNYFGYAQQAARGAVLFHNKLSLEPHAPALVNAEWWLLGRLSRALGGRLLLAWRVLGLAAALAFVLLVDAWLRRAGLPRAHRLPALLLVLLGGGLGGLLHALRWPARLNPLDMTTGLFPFIELLANPHFVCGTALLMASLLKLGEGERRGQWIGVGLAALAGVVRPYDFVMAVAVFVLWVALQEPPRAWPRRLWPLLTLAPVAGYLGWVFYRLPSYRVFAAAGFAPPHPYVVAVAVAPSLLLALATRSWAAEDPAAARVRAALWIWVVTALAVAALRPVSFSLQFLAGIGMPLLALAALGLSRFPPWVTAAVALALSSSAVAALRAAWNLPEAAFAPLARLAAARALGPVCRGGEVTLAPPDVSLYSLAYSSCRPYVAHWATAGYFERLAEVRSFYESDPADRAALLDRRRVSVLVLPAAPAPCPPATPPLMKVAAGDGYVVCWRSLDHGLRSPGP
jgi:hypothetical protein